MPKLMEDMTLPPQDSAIGEIRLEMRAANEINNLAHKHASDRLTAVERGLDRVIQRVDKQSDTLADVKASVASNEAVASATKAAVERLTSTLERQAEVAAKVEVVEKKAEAEDWTNSRMSRRILVRKWLLAFTVPLITIMATYAIHRVLGKLGL